MGRLFHCERVAARCVRAYRVCAGCAGAGGRARGGNWRASEVVERGAAAGTVMAVLRAICAVS